MTRLFKLYSILVFGFLTSCSKNEEITPISIEGKWKLNTINYKIKTNDSPLDNTQQNFSSKNLILDLKTDGTYTINAKFSLAELEESNETTKGAYSLSGNKVVLTYFDESLSSNVNINFDVKSSSDNNLVFNLSKEGLFKTIDDVIDKADALTATLMKLFQNSIIEYDVSYNFEKSV